MSVTTRADEKLDEVREHISNSISCLNEILDPNTWGSDEYKEIFKHTLNDVRHKLTQIQIDLK